jgi:hypothetical protein
LAPLLPPYALVTSSLQIHRILDIDAVSAVTWCNHNGVTVDTFLRVPRVHLSRYLSTCAPYKLGEEEVSRYLIDWLPKWTVDC